MNREEMELERELKEILGELNICGYFIERKRVSVRIVFTLHRAPEIIKELDKDPRDRGVGLADFANVPWFIKYTILNLFVPPILRDVSRRYVNVDDEVMKSHVSRLKRRANQIKKLHSGDIGTDRYNRSKDQIKREILSFCRQFKVDKHEFMKELDNEMTVETVMKS